MAVGFFLLLSSLGLAITAQAQGCARPVPGPNMNLKDNDIFSQDFPNGTKVSFACEVGHQSAGGSAAITCTDGNWSPVKLKCERKNCGALDNVINGEITYPTSTLFGDTAVVSCNEGHIRVGRDKIRCGDAGWMDRLPVCEVVKCNPPPAISDGTFYPEKESYDYNEVVQYTCQKGITLSGSKSLVCSADGTFTPAPPTCKNVQCEDPNIVNADWTAGSRSPYKYKATVTHQCRTGYVMIGESTSVCDIDGQWAPKLLECKPKDCSKPVGGVDMHLKDKDVPSQSFPHSTSVTFVCDDGYESAGGSAVTTCTTGKWSTVTLKCKKLPTPTADKPGEKVGDEEEPGSGGISNAEGIGAGVAGGLLLFGGAGAGAYYKKKKKEGSKEGPAENETTYDGESVQLQSCKHSAPVSPTLLDVKTSD